MKKITCTLLTLVATILLSSSVLADNTPTLADIPVIEFDFDMADSFALVSAIEFTDAIGTSRFGGRRIYHATEEGLFLSQKLVFANAYGNIIVEKHYISEPVFTPSGEIVQTHARHQTFGAAGGTRIWVQGRFTIDADRDRVTVTNINGDVSTTELATISNRSLTSRNNVANFPFNFASVTLSATVTTRFGTSVNLSVTLNVNSRGQSNATWIGQ